MKIICPHGTKVKDYTMGSCQAFDAKRPTFAIEFSQPTYDMVFWGHRHLRFDNREAVIADYAHNCMKYEMIGLAGSALLNPILPTRFCNVSDVSDRVL
jgi:hypothetical protein